MCVLIIYLCGLSMVVSSLPFSIVPATSVDNGLSPLAVLVRPSPCPVKELFDEDDP